MNKLPHILSHPQPTLARPAMPPLASRAFTRLMLWLRLCLISLIGLISLSTGAWAQSNGQLVAPPKLTSLLVDEAQLLNSADAQQIRERLHAYERDKGSQIAIITLKSTEGEDLFAFSQRAAEQYKLGRQGVGDGVLIVVAAQDRKIWLYVMRHLEGALPDLAAKRIVSEHITPAFKQQQYAAGLNAGITQIIARINGEALPPPVNPPAQADWDWTSILVLVGVGTLLGSNIAGSWSRWLVAPSAGTAVAAIAYDMTQLMWLGMGSGVIVLILVFVFGSRRFQMSLHREDHGSSIAWPTGWSGSNGGYSNSSGSSGSSWGGSFGGGDAGGGGAGGDW